ncbi:hypothetical protein, partial [Aquitalea magnusonii]|uniref:hypothetical protein n=1 Tax=Aquitalea magnusonii TaxID=332411 RepID=UPI00195C2B30
ARQLRDELRVVSSGGFAAALKNTGPPLRTANRSTILLLDWGPSMGRHPAGHSPAPGTAAAG